MIIIAKFEPKFFIDLYKKIREYGILWVMEDGNIYPTEKSAIAKATDKNKLARINREKVETLRWVRIDINNIPVDAKELADLFDKQEIEQRKKQRDMVAAMSEEPVIEMSDAQALAELQELKARSVESKMNKDAYVKFGETDVLAARAKAILKIVLGSFGHTSGVEKTQAAIDALSEEEKAKFGEELAKE